MSFFLSENSEKRHLFTLATPFPISGVPSKNRKSNPKSNPKLIKVVTLNSNRNSNPKLKITTRKGIKKGGAISSPISIQRNNAYKPF